MAITTIPGLANKLNRLLNEIIDIEDDVKETGANLEDLASAIDSVEEELTGLRDDIEQIRAEEEEDEDESEKEDDKEEDEDEDE